jgi:hypothetical protein
MRKIEFNLSDNNIELLTKDIKLSELTHVGLLVMKVLKEYSDENKDDFNFDSAVQAMISTVKAK